MEMYPQKPFAPGRRRINAAHHVLPQPIWTFFDGTRVFVLLCHVPVRASCIFVLPINATVTCPDKRRSRTKQRRLRQQDHHPNDHLP